MNIRTFLFATANLEIFAVTLCLGAVILDAMDGWYARKFSQISQFGKFLDPLADQHDIDIGKISAKYELLLEIINIPSKVERCTDRRG